VESGDPPSIEEASTNGIEGRARLARGLRRTMLNLVAGTPNDCGHGADRAGPGLQRRRSPKAGSVLYGRTRGSLSQAAARGGRSSYRLSALPERHLFDRTRDQIVDNVREEVRMLDARCRCGRVQIEVLERISPVVLRKRDRWFLSIRLKNIIPADRALPRDVVRVVVGR